MNPQLTPVADFWNPTPRRPSTARHPNAVPPPEAGRTPIMSVSGASASPFTLLGAS
jgi:hypothetical protein